MSDANLKITAFAKQVGQDLKENEIIDKRQDQMIGDITRLKTKEKMSAVDAINEIADKIENYDDAPDFVAQFLLALQ